MSAMAEPARQVAKGTGAGHSTVVGAVALMYFLSGLCSLIDEVVWVRLLKLTFGNTVYATSIVVSVFMGGLALGSYVMSRCADRVKRRLRLYAQLEFLAAISALSIPYVLRAVDWVYRWVYLHAPSWLMLPVQVVLSAGILLVPTMVMGSTLPLLGRYVALLEARVGKLVGRLYALNMLGAALGCFLAGFVLIRAIGVMPTLYVAAFVNLLVAIGGWALSFLDFSAVSPPRTDEDANVEPGEEGAPIAEPSNGRPSYLLAAGVFASGLVCIAYEVLWMRSIVFPLGGTTYVFAAVLTTYLLGNVLGVWVGSRLAGSVKRPGMVFGLSLSLLGILGIAYVPALATWHFGVGPQVLAFFRTFLTDPRLSTMALPILYTFFLLVVPSTVMGIGFPLALQQWCAQRDRAGRTTGIVYGINTTGGVLGGLAAGFVFIPLLGVQWSMVVLGLALLWLGAALVCRFSGTEHPGLKLSFPAVILVISLLALAIPTDIFVRWFGHMPGNERVGFKEGITTTVAVHREKGSGELALSTSGVKVAGDSRDLFRIPQKVLGHLGILLNTKTEAVLSVGFGCGETTECMSRHPLERIDAVEISPELVAMALEHFSHLNLGEVLHEKVNVYYMDAKNYLHLTDRKYDLIVNDCINPKQFAENASLYTREYLDSARARLNPGGIFGTYLPVGELPISCIDSILGTMAESFPYLTVWLPVSAPSDYYDFFYIAGSADSQRFSPAYIDRTLSRPAIRESASYLNFIDSRYVLSCYLGDRDDLARYLREYRPNSDYTPFVEFCPDQAEERPEKLHWLASFASETAGNSLDRYLDWTGMTDDERDAWQDDYEEFREVSSYLLRMRGKGMGLAYVLQDLHDAAKIRPDHKSLHQQERLLLGSVRERAATQLSHASQIAAQVDTLLSRRPEIGVAWLVRSYAAQALDDSETAIDAARKALALAPDSVQVQENLEALIRSSGSSNGAERPPVRQTE